MNNNKSLLKAFVPHILAILFFLVLTLIYFQPILDGKTLQQGDISQWRGMAQELAEFDKNTENAKSAWSGSMFSGMPSYHFNVVGNPPNFLSYVQHCLYLADPGSMGPVFAGLLCAYIFFFLLTSNVFLSVLGAIAIAFSSYNIIILQAGHVTKAWAIAYIPLVLSGFLLIFKKRFLLGGALFALALAFELMSGHVQITYYLAIFCLILFIGYVIYCIQKKEWKTLQKATLTLLISVFLGILPNIAGLYADLEMSKSSLRGPTELTAQADELEEKSDGLDIDYAFAWSYGRTETLSLMIPNIYGGASGGTLGKDSNLYKSLKANGQRMGKDVQSYTYWGEQPFTSGPVYLGAIVCFLFVLGMFVIKNNTKWWLLGAAIFFIFLSWGKNIAWFNDFWFYHLPMYNKFRTPSMALVIPSVIFPIVGVWGLKRIWEGKVEMLSLKKSLIYSLSIVGGICLVLWLIPGFFFNFQSQNDAQFATQVPNWYYESLLADRKDLLRADALRSLIFVILSASFVYLAVLQKKQLFRYSLVILCLLVLVDLWMVDKRYLNDSSFQRKKTEQYFEKTYADESILEDKSPSYRVLNMSTNTFNETATSYFHKSIGGYHAAKLRRYQELIDFRIMREIQWIGGAFQHVSQNSGSMEDLYAAFEMTPTLNMLNAKYIIYNPEAPALVNPYAFGNAWFVENVEWVDNANEELDALEVIDPLTTAVVDKKYADVVEKTSAIIDSNDVIELVEYQPNYLKYETKTSSEQIAIFSEIYYNRGWKAFIDGQPVDHFRANWVLRAMNIPAGEHLVEFRFEPDTYNRLAVTGSAVSLLLIIGFVGICTYVFVKKKKAEK